MKVQGFACDVCEKFGSDTEAWFNVTRNGTSTDVCSPDCLSKLGRQIKLAEAPPMPSGPRANGGPGPGGTTPNTDPCPECGRMFPTRQGLGAHMTRVHGVRGGITGWTAQHEAEA
jgi:C2H2-type zinc finger